MRQIFEEYGRVIVAVIATAAVLGLLLGSLNLFGLLGDVTEVDTDVSYNQGESALDTVVKRKKPEGNFDSVDLHIYKNAAFRPLTGVKFTDAEGRNVDAKVLSILYYDSDGNKTELINNYNKDNGVVILNTGHYSGSHLECSPSEFTDNGCGSWIINNEDAYNCPGVVVVTYSATDSENQTTVEQQTFVVDNKMK